jgi:hypothetical protein
MLSKDVKRIIRENKKYTDMLAECDKTGVLPLKKTRNQEK